MRYILLGILLLYSSWTDIKKREVSVKALIIFGILGIMCGFLGASLNFVDMSLGVLVGLIVVAISVISKGELGLGDGFLLCISGLYLGVYKNSELILIGTFLAAIYSIILVIMKHSFRQEFPFVPFLAISYIFLLFGM